MEPASLRSICRDGTMLGAERLEARPRVVPRDVARKLLPQGGVDTDWAKARLLVPIRLLSVEREPGARDPERQEVLGQPSVIAMDEREAGHESGVDVAHRLVDIRAHGGPVGR